MKRGSWAAYGVLLLGALWLVLTATGKLGAWVEGFAGRLPPLLTLTAALAIPVLAALCSLRIQMNWGVRITLLVLLLACVPLLPVVFESHPIVVVMVSLVFMVEEFGIIPWINRRWIVRNRLE